MVDKTLNNMIINVKFDEYANHTDNLVSKESLQVSLGKIKKWKTDFHSCVWNGNAATVNNHTVLSDVPADAAFTDTIYTLPAATNETLGGVIIGDGIDVDENGVISVVSNSNYDSGWINVTIDDGYILSQDIQYRKIATGLIELCGTFTPSQQFQFMTLFTLPDGYRPHKKRVFTQVLPQSQTPFSLVIDTTGEVDVVAPSSYYFKENVTYYIEAMFII